MRYIILIAFLSLILWGCSEKKDGLTKVDINTLNVPDSFSYETVRPVDIFISGLYKQTVRIYGPNEQLLVKGLVDPLNGLHTKINIPYTVESVKIEYGDEVANVSIGTGNMLDHSFLPAY
ncbi:MAG: hypothetical protein PHI68_05135 [Candidatus Cloacimonetes bacterium]|nr:hypothetical protein [Candidatus Cloacimonadota bacterium]